jgi:hypothetical protein
MLGLVFRSSDENLLTVRTTLEYILALSRIGISDFHFGTMPTDPALLLLFYWITKDILSISHTESTNIFEDSRPQQKRLLDQRNINL